MINPKHFELADTAPHDETAQACEALNEAIMAMANNNSNPHDIAVIATLYGVMRQENARAFRAEQMIQAVGSNGGSK